MNAHRLRRIVAWSLAWVAAGAFYLLLIDTTDLPELLVGAGAAATAATATELVRERGLLGEGFAPGWLLRLFRPLLSVPRDVVWLCLLALRQIVAREEHVGRFRTLRFAPHAAESPARASGRRATAQVTGSLSPNTFVIAIDEQRRLILAHQLRATPGRSAVDPLELG